MWRRGRGGEGGEGVEGEVRRGIKVSGSVKRIVTKLRANRKPQ